MGNILSLKPIHKFLLACLVVSIVLSLLACSATRPATLSATNTATVLPTKVSPSPTVELKKMLISTQSSDCALPCYLGIIPDKTTVVSAEKILESYSGNKLGEYPEGIFTSYSYTISIEPYPHESIWFGIHLLALNDLVKKVKVTAVLGLLSQASVTAWEPYSVRSIFLQMGPPDRVFVYTDKDFRSLTILYLEQGVTISLGSPSWRFDKDICTGSVRSPYHISMTLNDIDYAQTIMAGNSPSSEQSIGQSINETFGFDEAEFYRRVASDQSVCFMVQNP